MCFWFCKGNTINTVEECTICFEEINKKNKGYKAQCCANYYHHKCINDWLAEHNTCPTCKRVAKSALPLSNNCYIEFLKENFCLINNLNSNYVSIAYSDVKNLNVTHLDNGNSVLCIELNQNWGGIKYKIQSETSIIILVKSTISNLR